MISYPHLAQRLFNVPLAIHPDKAEMVMAALADRFGIAQLFRADTRVVIVADGGAASEIAAGADLGGGQTVRRAYDVVAGVAIIPVQGTLVQKLGSMRPYSGMTGYDGIRANLSMALTDAEVRAIVLDIDSSGGEVAGCFDLADAIWRSRGGGKPIWAILSEAAYSAAYALASACDRIIVPRTGGTGSIGVICMHVDFSQALSAAGITVTLIHHGARKADYSEFQPLSDKAAARLQGDIDAMGELFVTTVARNRKLSPAKVRATEAGTFRGAAGRQAGLADAVMAPDEAFRKLLAELG